MGNAPGLWVSHILWIGQLIAARSAVSTNCCMSCGCNLVGSLFPSMRLYLYCFLDVLTWFAVSVTCLVALISLNTSWNKHSNVLLILTSDTLVSRWPQLFSVEFQWQIGSGRRAPPLSMLLSRRAGAPKLPIELTRSHQSECQSMTGTAISRQPLPLPKTSSSLQAFFFSLGLY